MILDYYQSELSKIKKLAKEFASAYPAIAPMLREQSTDPDIERLLEGVAFLTSQIQILLDDNLPDMVDDLTQLFFSQYSRALPSTSIIQFVPKPNLGEAIHVKKGTELASIPINGTQCLFRTVVDVEVEPVLIEQIIFKESLQGDSLLEINCQLCGVTLQNWKGKELRFFIKQPWEEACNTFYMLQRYVKRIILRADNEKEYILPLENLVACALESDDPLYPLAFKDDNTHCILHQYINQPYKFLFFKLKGFEKWIRETDATNFRISLEFKDIPVWFSPPETGNLILHTVPIINLFEHHAEPIQLDHKKPEYRVIPSDNADQHYQIYEVKQVIGYRQREKRQIVYDHVLNFNDELDLNKKYTIHNRPSISGNGRDIYVGFFYNFGQEYPVDETLSVTLTCTNGDLTTLLDEGDITRFTDSSPENLSFTNIIPPSSNIPPVHNQALIWNFQSLLVLNFIQILDKSYLKQIVNLYLYEKGENYHLNMSRIQGVEDILVEKSRRLYLAEMIAGVNITLVCEPDHFKSIGDMYLFGCILDIYFSQNSPMNTFTQLSLKNSRTKETWKWTPRLNNPHQK
ncbi:hypothetical protein B1207_12160 [Legionella quinlivanii]|uniref:Type VI secretion system protein ImpG n=1 Tax=Legionella quinlivanii TaxID=45073 RepID=A0A364LGU4_9GAMM|nr:type VI secretion system baseplate subunit TssF [Legionella quinlivanii]RAP35451.1 hypothetical protein B1207_12160 [Legionella quinlivanii]